MLKAGKNRNGRSILFAAAVAVMGLCIPAARAAISVNVVNDTWQDSSRTDPAAPVYSEYGRASDGDTNIESSWFVSGAGRTSTASPGSLVLTPTAGNSGTYTTYFTPEATPVTLAQGDTLKVTWVFTPHGVNTSNTSQNLHIGLMDSPAAARVSTDA